MNGDFVSDYAFCLCKLSEVVLVSSGRSFHLGLFVGEGSHFTKISFDAQIFQFELYSNSLK